MVNVADIGKRLLLGRKLRSTQLGETLLPKRIALPVFASDALSSVAYAPDEIFLTLSLAGLVAYSYSWKIAIAGVTVATLVVHLFSVLLGEVLGQTLPAFWIQLASGLAFIFFALVAWMGYVELLYSWEIKESTMGSVRFPLYPARVLLLVGVALLLLRLAVDIAQDIGRLRRGEPPPEVALPEQRE